MAIKRHIQLPRSNQEGKTPDVTHDSGLTYGEIAINYAAGKEFLTIKNSNNGATTFPANIVTKGTKGTTGESITNITVSKSNSAHTLTFTYGEKKLGKTAFDSYSATTEAKIEDLKPIILTGSTSDMETMTIVDEKGNNVNEATLINYFKNGKNIFVYVKEMRTTLAIQYSSSVGAGGAFFWQENDGRFVFLSGNDNDNFNIRWNYLLSKSTFEEYSANVNTIIENLSSAVQVSIVAPVNTTDATLPITTLTTEVGKYYRLDVAVETLTVKLPAITDLTTVRTVVIYLTAGTLPAITIASADSKDVYYQDGYAIEAGKTYEVNCLWNGAAWIVASVEINVGG